MDVQRWLHWQDGRAYTNWYSVWGGNEKTQLHKCRWWHFGHALFVLLLLVYLASLQYVISTLTMLSSISPRQCFFCNKRKKEVDYLWNVEFENCSTHCISLVVVHVLSSDLKPPLVPTLQPATLLLQVTKHLHWLLGRHHWWTLQHSMQCEMEIGHWLRKVNEFTHALNHNSSAVMVVWLRFSDEVTMTPLP